MNKESFNSIVEFVKNVGFPIGVAIWLLYQGDKTITRLTDAIIEMKNTMVNVSISLTDHVQEQRRLRIYDREEDKQRKER